VRAQFLEEERKKPVCHSLWAPHLTLGRGQKRRLMRWILLVPAADISTEHSRNGSHCSPMKRAIMDHTHFNR